MSKLPTIRVKSDNPAHESGFIIRNADDLRYGETLFKADEFESLGEHGVRLKLESSPPNDFFEAEAKLWLDLKEAELIESETSARTTREIETLSIAKESNKIARDAFRWSRYATIIAVTGTVVAYKESIFELLSIIYP